MSNAIYSEQDYSAINEQIRRRSLLMGIPCALLLATLVASFIVRLEWLTATCTILIGAILIAGYDLFLKPLVCYRRFLDNVLHGRTHETILPFVSIGEDINLVDGVPCRALSCQDIDGKGRPYDRLFYFDCAKTFPSFDEGQHVCIVHHDLLVANVFPAQE